METNIEECLGKAIRDLLLDQESVRIKGLGEFTRVHIKQHQEKHNNGQVVLMPPRDIIEFTAE